MFKKRCKPSFCTNYWVCPVKERVKKYIFVVYSIGMVLIGSLFWHFLFGSRFTVLQNIVYEWKEVYERDYATHHKKPVIVSKDQARGIVGSIERRKQVTQWQKEKEESIQQK